MVPAPSDKVSRVSSYSGSCWAAWDFGYGAFTLSGGTSQSLLLSYACLLAVRTPACTHAGLGSFHFARRYFGNRCFFLFLRVLRCFSSPGSPRMTMDSPYADRGSLCRVSPFGYLRISGYVLLPEAFRSLSRPSSALSAKASTLRPSYFDRSWNGSIFRSSHSSLMHSVTSAGFVFSFFVVNSR